MQETITVLHPGVERAPATDIAARVAQPSAGPALAPRLATLAGKRIALLDNAKVNAGTILAALAKRLQVRHGAADVRAWKKRHAGETGAPLIPHLLEWKPDLVLTAIGD